MADEGVDVITSGHERIPGPSRRGGLLWLLVIAEAVALAASIAVALHYRAQAGGHATTRPFATSTPAQLPQVTSVMAPLLAQGKLTVTVHVIAARQPGGEQTRLLVAAVLTGGKPGTVYDLTGNDCSLEKPPPDHVWASGKAAADGTASLTGAAWTGAEADYYWLALDPSPTVAPPGLNGYFAAGSAQPYAVGEAPCAQPPP